MPVLDGRRVPYVNLDNAASTPPLRAVVDDGRRSSCPATRACTAAAATSRASRRPPTTRRTARSRASSAPTRDTAAVIFGKNTTEAINKLSYRYPLPPDAVVLTTLHGAPLERPALARARARSCARASTPEGRLDEDALRPAAARGMPDRVALVDRDAARSNVTGYVQPRPPAGAQGARGRRAHPGGLRAAGAAPRDRRARARRSRSTSTTSRSPRTSCTRRSAPARWSDRRDIFQQGAPEYRGGGTVERRHARRGRAGRRCPTARRPAARTSSARSRWRRRCRRCQGSGWTRSPRTSARSRPTRCGGSRLPGVTRLRRTRPAPRRAIASA